MHRVATLVAAAIIALAADVLLSVRPWGLGFLLFATITLATVVILASATNRLTNRWALALALPILVLAADVFIYANPVVHVLAPLAVYLLLLALILWLFADHIPFRKIGNIVPMELFFRLFEAIPAIPDPFKGFKFSKQTRAIIIGFAAAIPFLLVFIALFTQADAIFSDLLRRVWTFKNLPDAFAHLIRFAIIGFGSAGLFAVTLRNPHRDKAATDDARDVGAALTAFLAALNVLFVIFITVQIVYLFGGKEYIFEHSTTFSQYARAGFFELLAASAIVFGIAGIAYRVFKPTTSSRALLVTLLVQTLVIVVSALRRLSFYTDAYGLSVSRFYAAAVIVFLGLSFVLFATHLIIKATFPTLERSLAIFFVIALTTTLTLNAEAIVARHNISRSRAGIGPTLDMGYLADLSTDVVPALYHELEFRPEFKNARERFFRRATHETRDFRSFTLSAIRTANLLYRGPQ